MAPMLFRVLCRHAPSRLLTALVAALVTLMFGLESGVMFWVAVAIHELGLWLDHYGMNR